MPEPLERLTRVIEAHMTDAIIDVYNALEEYSACSGIKDDPDNALKALANEEGRYGLKGSYIPPRRYITNATSSGTGTHKRMPNADVALRRVITEAIQNSIRRKQVTDIGYKSSGSNKAFGTTNSPKKVMKAVAQQMLENQLVALNSVTPKNTDATLAKKKKRSTKPLIDYGDMMRATRCWVEHDGEEDDAE